VSKDQKHIVVIRLSAMGDIAMTIPVLRAFQQQYPDVKLTILTRKFFRPFFRDLKQVNFIDFDPKVKHKSIFGLYRLSLAITKTKPLAVADLHNVLRTNVLKFFLRGIYFKQIDKGRNEKKALVSGKSFKPLKTTIERYSDVFKSLGFPLDFSNSEFPIKPELSTRVYNLIGQDHKKWIGIAPFAAFKGKMYPMDLMEQVIKQLGETYKLLLFGGGDKEQNSLKTLEEKFDSCLSLVGVLTLDEELDVMGNLDVMLAMDSGNAHMAAMMGVNVITLWGVTHPYAGFSPFNQPEHYNILADRKKFPLIPTSVYGNNAPEAYLEAMRTITPNTIVNKIKSILKA
jgi:ADP-heptose:LPS heptosyltransferase